MTNKYTVHGVLAGAYKGKDIGERVLLHHASLDDGGTALCKRVREDMLCDMYETGEPTCPICLKRIGARGLVKDTRKSHE